MRFGSGVQDSVKGSGCIIVVRGVGFMGSGFSLDLGFGVWGCKVQGFLVRRACAHSRRNAWVGGWEPGFRVSGFQGLGFGFRGLRVWDSIFGVWGPGIRMLDFEGHGFGFRGLGARDSGFEF